LEIALVSGFLLVFTAAGCFPGGNTQKAPIGKPLAPPDSYEGRATEPEQNPGDSPPFLTDGISGTVLPPGDRALLLRGGINASR
jgi:hypothetical protein